MNATSCYWSYIDFFTLFIIIYLLTLTILTQPPEQNSEAAVGDVLKNFANFTGKHLCWSLFFKKLQAFRSAALLKRDSYTGVFLSNLRNLKNTYFEKHLYDCFCVLTTSSYINLNNIYSTQFSFLQIASSLLRN